MIKSIEMSAYGPIKELKCNNFGRINLLIGPNGIGKTTMLKALYAGVKSVEQVGRGNEPRTIKEILASKLYWTFQSDNIGSLVGKKESKLQFSMRSDKGEELTYSFGPTTTKQIVNLTSTFEHQNSDSIFIPAKEVLSLRSLIEESRSDKFNSFGFDDTYYDLAKALRPRQKGKNYKQFADARTKLNDAINGRIEYDETQKEWVFYSKDTGVLPISLTSEGIKKVSILDVLLGNHYLSKQSVIIIDEPESALHPTLVSTFMDIVFSLAQCGIQFFIASHSYFVIKKLYILAHQHKVRIPVISFDNGMIETTNLAERMPTNSILNESVRLYEEEIEL
ncbi:MAG: ATP-binding protein [Bacteroidales bacterium]|nr:ATP-binding protein [Bacteroidales bacterium]